MACHDAAMASDDAADELYGVPLSQFVAERKRLGLGKAKKPNLSAWAVNQLHRRAPDEMKALFAAGAKLRKGDFAATAEQRAVLGALRTRAAAILKEDGHAASETTLHRVHQTLQALSAHGTWAPDEPGQLTDDRDPPGFDALAGIPPSAIRAPAREAAAPPVDKKRERELEKLEAARDAARADADARAADVDQLRDALEQAETALAEARREAAEAEEALERARRRE
jgi:hypothetical protein